MNDLIENVHKIHTTEMGVDRISRNLKLSNVDVVNWCQNVVMESTSSITRKGKNWYVENDICVITINAYSYTIITAHPVKKQCV